MTYDPHPADTADVELSDDLVALTERLAAHIHDVWAQRRIEEGWTYGARRDDNAMTHPGLVPYEELSESEKEYDRRTALGTIRAILALGYRITPPGEREDATTPPPPGHNEAHPSSGERDELPMPSGEHDKSIASGKPDNPKAPRES